MNTEKSAITGFLADNGDIKHLQEVFQEKGELSVYGLGDGQRTLVTATLLTNQQKRNLLVLCDTQKRAKELWEDLGQLMQNYEVLYFPAMEMIPFEILAKSGELEQKRTEVLAKLLLAPQTPHVIITTVEGFGKQLLPVSDFKSGILSLEVGKVIEPEALKQHLVRYGYDVVEQIEQMGQLAYRGGILDVYSPVYEYPIRIEFFDDEVDSIRFFKVDNQLSVDKTEQVYLTPAKEFFLLEERIKPGIEAIRNVFTEQIGRLSKKKDREPLERLQGKIGEVIEKAQQGINFVGLEQYQHFFYPQSATLLEYMGKDTTVVIDEVNRLQEAQEHLQREREHSFTALLMRGGVLPGQEDYFLTLNDIVDKIHQLPAMYFSLMPKPSVFAQTSQLYTIDCKTIPPFFGKIELLVSELNNWLKQRYGVVILLTSEAKAERLKQLLEDHDLTASWIADRYQYDQGQIYLALGNLNQGAQFMQSHLVLITENEVFQQPKKRVNKKMFHEDGQRITHLDDLKVGDYVVHLSHGIGQYLGIERLKTEGVERDYLLLKYADNAKVYVPVDRFELLQKYVLEEGRAPKINKLGTSDWQKTKMKVKASVEQMAEQLLEIYARRQSQPGFAFSPDDHWQKEFEDAFPYVETEDQLKAIEETKADMMKPVVMDRLICGDVGYGKTEVAIRAAFKAVNDGKQVAILVPTTVLAQQHFNTFEQRFSPYGIKVELLSRFRTTKEQNAVIAGLKNGTVDIVVGTHKLLNKSVVFKDLGLLTIDEEQRFGVTHKEKIKAMRSQVDVLTLSATPIPRTLHMSLVGIRDMSIIETPPQDRYPIQTYIVEHTPELINDAIRREIGRGGQIYYVHNRVEDIAQIAEAISQLVPEARIVVGHGQMKEQELENIMLHFINHEADILVCTTIIETGLDIANANTLIVDDADKMGLAQLYQLRGRVGRSNRVAYAYLTYKRDRTLSPVAEKRLAAIREYTDLGSGFKIAMRDLEIRGAGNLLGAEQHGQVCAVGFDLYCKLLDDAIRRLKGETTQKEIEVEIDLTINSFIPDYYIKDSATKLGFYQRIQRTNSAAKLELLADEMVDRFGDIPPETENLLKIAELKTYCHDIRAKSIKQKAGIIYITFDEDAQLDMPGLFEAAKQFQRRLTYGNTGGELVLKVTIGSMNAKECLDLVKDVLLALIAVVENKASLL